MRGKWLTILMFCLACTEDDFPPDIYGYQIERLLSGGGEKVWLQVINSTNCIDSTRLFIREVSDSIAVSNLRPSADCTGFDTIVLGNANASVTAGGIIFTDSINFVSGDFWLIESITSNSLSIVSSENTVSSYLTE